ncbi:MAG: hypothetical protein ABI352_10510 [Candidatus Dormibacter sp.]
MGTWRRRVVLSALAALLSGCDSATPSAIPTPTPGPTASTRDAAGAMAGFLAAAAQQDNTQVPLWLATNTDTADLNEVLSVYSTFGLEAHGGLFWAVSGLDVAAVNRTDAIHADVTLTGDIVWCLGKAANDPAATCSAIDGVTGHPHTYVAVSLDGRWGVDVDINASSQLDQNPQASPAGQAPAATPS